MPPSDPICFTHDEIRWVARQWPTSAYWPNAQPERLWQIKPKHPESGLPDYLQYRAALNYFERSCA